MRPCSVAAVRVLLDLLGPEHDADPPGLEEPPARPYLVCSTPRSGSGLLCRGLAARGAGAPLEYFNGLHRGRLAERWACGPGLDGYVRALYARRATADGVLGVKLHWDQLVNLRAEALGTAATEPGYRLSAAFAERLFPGAAYVRTIRLDVDRQAVSLWFALVGGTWSIAAGDGPDGARDRVPYDFAGIDRCRRLIENAELHWDRFLRHNGIEPLVVVYEELASAYPDGVARVLETVAPERRAGAPPEPATRRLSDDRTERFVARFAEDRARSGLPDPLAADR